jgi:SAM-dependent methyltransferase
VTAVDYATWHDGVSGADLAGVVRDWAEANPGGRVCDVGAGANPILDAGFVARCGLQYALLDIDQGELDKAPDGYARVCADVSDPAFVPPDTYDLVITQTVAEHVADGAAFHRNVAALLRPGGVAVHFFPTWWTLPFMVNRLVPEEVSEPVLLRIQPHRAPDGNEGKFPARYEWCRGPTRRQLRRLREAGFEVERYRGYFGHDYYTPIGPLQRLEHAKSRFLVRHPVAHLTSYALVVARRR